MLKEEMFFDYCQIGCNSFSLKSAIAFPQDFGVKLVDKCSELYDLYRDVYMLFNINYQIKSQHSCNNFYFCSNERFK
jgi:hypothetical protein